jgi:hypothetical protein
MRAAPDQQLTYSGNDVEYDRMPLFISLADSERRRFLPGTRARNWRRTDVGGLFLAGGVAA